VTAPQTSDLVVDAHHHLWEPTHGYTWLSEPAFAPIRRPFTVDDLRAAIGPAGVRRTVLVEAAREHPDEVPEQLAVAAATDEIAGVVGWIDLTDRAIVDTIAAYRELPGAEKLVGLRDQVQGRTEPGFLARADVRANLAAIGVAGLTYDLVVTVDQLADVAGAVEAVPGVRFVLDHLGKPRIAGDGFAEWRAAIAPLAAFGNVAVKVSGMVTEADWATWTVADLRPYVETAVELFGPDRLMYGSDWPVCTVAASYQQVLDALRQALPPLTEAERAAIFGGTAVRVYGLEI